ncbi:MAG: TetR family transcriptional regulator [Steroidobacteraceae bacterium]
MARKSRAEALVTRDRILDTAEKVFEKKGVSRTTLEDIASAAGVTRGAIYGHFRNKGDLFVAMFERVHLPMDSRYALGADDHTDPLGRLRALLVDMLKAVSSNRRDQRVLNIVYHKCEFTDDMHDAVAGYRKMSRREAMRIRMTITHAIEKGQLPAKLNVERAETLFHAVLIGLLGNWTLSPRSFNLHRDAEALAASFIDMLKLSPSLRD